MKIASSTSQRPVRILVALLILVSSPRIQAADTWVGGTAADWNSSNWAGVNNPPVSGDALVFQADGAAGAVASDNLRNDLTTSSFVVAGLTFTTAAPAYSISGNAFTLTTGITNNSSNTQTIADNITLSGANTFSGVGGLTLSGNLSGTGGLVNVGPGLLVLSGTNSFGTFTGQNSTVEVTSAGGASAATATTPLGTGALTMDGATVIFNPNSSGTNYYKIGTVTPNTPVGENVISISKGAGTSTVVTTSAISVFNPTTLVIAAQDGLANLGAGVGTGADQFFSTAAPSQVLSGDSNLVASFVVGQDNNSNHSGDLLGYTGAKGFYSEGVAGAEVTTFVSGSGINSTPANGNLVALTAPSTSISGNNAVASLVLGNSTTSSAGNLTTLNNTGTLQVEVGSSGVNDRSYLILNNAAITGTGTLSFNFTDKTTNGVARGEIYTDLGGGSISNNVVADTLEIFGPGTLTLSGTNTLNIFDVSSGTTSITGTTTVNGIATGSTGSFANGVHVTAGATLTESSTGVIAGATRLYDDGTVILAGQNTYTGGTVVDSLTTVGTSNTSIATAIGAGGANALYVTNGAGTATTTHSNNTNGSATGTSFLNVGSNNATGASTTPSAQTVGATFGGTGTVDTNQGNATNTGTNIFIFGGSAALPSTILVGQAPGAMTATNTSLTVLGSSLASNYSQISYTNLEFNIDTTAAGVGNELNVGATTINFGANVTMTLALQGTGTAFGDNFDVLVAGTAAVGGAFDNGSQYEGLILGASTGTLATGLYTLITDSGVGGAGNLTLAGMDLPADSLLYLYQNSTTGADDIVVGFGSAAVPEPSSQDLLALGTGLLLLYSCGRRFRGNVESKVA